jgi:predicted permease
MLPSSNDGNSSRSTDAEMPTGEDRYLNAGAAVSGGCMRTLIRRLRYWLRQRDFDAALREELEFHQDQARQQLEREGASPVDAAFAARRAMGNTILSREDARAVWIWPWLESLCGDVRYASRNLLRQPAFTVAALAILAASIGPIATLFTLVSDTVFQPWRGVPDASGVIRIYGVDSGEGRRFGLSHPEYRYVAAQATRVTGVVAWRNETVRVDERGDATARVTLATPNFFRVLSPVMERGRGLVAVDDARGAPQRVVVLSAEFWQGRFAGDPAIVGREIRLDGVPFEVVGVVSREFAASEGASTSMWLPFGALALLRPGNAQVAAIDDPRNCCSQVAARLVAGATRDQARSEIEILSNRFRASVGLDGRPLVVSGTSFLPARESRSMLIVAALLFSALLLVMLLACANIGNLLLAKAAARRREISLRLSLGATRRRIVRQLLTESLVLALAAGAIGLLAATQVAPFLARLTGAEGGVTTPGGRIDWIVIGATFTIACMACLAFGLAPALHATRVPLLMALKTDSVTSGRLAMRSILLGTQVAITVLFLACASLFLRGAQQARTLDLGFALDDAAVMSFGWPAEAYDVSRKGNFLRAVAAQLGNPGGLPIGLADWEPFEGSSGEAPVRIPGQGSEQASVVNTIGVSAGYFDVLRIPIAAGRNFSATDSGSRPVLINETLARRLWPNEIAVGKTFLSGDREPVEHVVVGVVKDALTDRVDRVAPTFYRVFDGALEPKLLIREDDDVARARVERIVAALDGRVRVQVQPLAANFSGEIAMSRRSAAIAGGLGSLALTLALVGMFGVFAYAVQQRTRELGVRIALGARSMDIIGLVLSGSAKPVVVGVGVGFLGGIASAQLLRHLLFGVSPFDPVALAGVAAIVAVAALVASCVPVHRAVHLDPVQALRYD